MENSEVKQPQFRLINYYYQWPLGDMHEVIAENLTREQAEILKREKSIGVTKPDFKIEEMNNKHNPVADKLSGSI